jgi:hypothetical protein
MKPVGKKSTKKLLAPIRSEDELQKILFIQRSCTRAAENEILALAIDNREPEKYIAAGKKLLDKYATYPTLTEFASNPNLANVYKWGATFGVTAVVGSLIIEGTKVLQPKFAPALRRMLLLFLKELDQPEHKNFTKYLWGELRMGFVKDYLPETTPIQWEIDRMQTDLRLAIETLTLVCSQYGLVISDGEKALLTPTGKRVLIHLVDAARFIDEMTKAHGKFQSKKQKPQH